MIALACTPAMRPAPSNPTFIILVPFSPGNRFPLLQPARIGILRSPNVNILVAVVQFPSFIIPVLIILMGY